ncbi:5-azacytidine-induced protein 2 isoform X1 [Conger conger]|uniref:5-azacytidine-induced protein 2 isoform X1 n=2 Tax=Conger conger TaxID=82655 RepID=UPI002A5A1C91|nr:5-azacytidine-induced protein 2 isoform X1 [Conger conger]
MAELKPSFAMDPMTVEDDICILRHETAYSTAESPVSVCSGDESVASHFALVTAYEDIKKRLRDTEKENAGLRKKVRQLEEKLYKPEGPTAEGPQYVNKAFSAYRGIYMEKKDLQMELNKVKREKSESEKMLTEQLQAQELQLLQLRTEVETHQVMKSLSSPQEHWQVDQVNSGLKIHNLQEELDRMTRLCRQLQESCKEKEELSNSVVESGQKMEKELSDGNAGLLQSYGELQTEMSRVREVAKLQAEMLKKLKDRPHAAHRRAASTIPMQCLDDVERNSRMVRIAAPRPPSAPPIPSSDGRPCPPKGPPRGPPMLERMEEDCWTSPRPPPVGSAAVQAPPSPSRLSLEDSSWSFPSPPKPSDALFWESPGSSARGPKTPSHDRDWLSPY